ncbi:unnamed protein product [marine sediment metagenome]|uniref:S1 motif domain-containing protein n=1 Tax=marine sediment metagenome TaxID=412755 RepID=X1BMX0_9ZZZZ
MGEGDKDFPEQRAEHSEKVAKDTLTDLEPTDMNEAYAQTLKAFEEGEILKGKVVRISRDDVFVDIGYKSEGIISIKEFMEPTGEISVKSGDDIDVYLERKENQDGLVVLSKVMADKKYVWGTLNRVYKNKETIEGTITRQVRGGLMVELGGIEGFLPSSQVGLFHAPNPKELIGQKISVRVIKFIKRMRNIVVSHRSSSKRRGTKNGRRCGKRFKRGKRARAP